VLARQQLIGVAVALADLDMDCRVAVAEIGIPLVAVHYRRVGTGLVGHYNTAQERELVILPELHWAGDRTEGWLGPSLRNWRGKVLAFR
jgi:hypothetical protein